MKTFAITGNSGPIKASPADDKVIQARQDSCCNPNAPGGTKNIGCMSKVNGQCPNKNSYLQGPGSGFEVDNQQCAPIEDPNNPGNYINGMYGPDDICPRDRLPPGVKWTPLTGTLPPGIKPDSAEEQLRAANRSLDRARASQEARASKPGSAVTLRALSKLRESGEIRGILGSLGELTSPKESAHEEALAYSLGGGMNSIVVSNDEVAASCIKWLGANGGGRATFLPLNKISASRAQGRALMVARNPGIIGFAHDLLDYDEEIETAVRFACRNSDPVAVTGWHMVLGSVPLLVWHVFDKNWPLVPDWSVFEWTLMSYSSLFGSALAYGLFFWFASRKELTSFSTLAFLTPVFALITGGIWLGERLYLLQWIGVVLVLISVLFVSQRRRFWGDKSNNEFIKEA